MIYRSLSSLMLLCVMPGAFGAFGELNERLALFAENDRASDRRVDHSAWQQLLDRYLVADHASGIWRMRYAAINETDQAALTAYLEDLQTIDPRTLHREEQMAFWINLYNAQTVALIVASLPVDSIRDLAPNPLAFGPWGRELMAMQGQALSLDDVEHGILRPIFRDPRIHFAVNCASLGCPNLSPVAYSRENLEDQLSAGARAYVTHPRGARFEGDTLVLSSIFDWYADDFGSNRATRLAAIARWTTPALAERVGNHRGAIRYEYDWALNAP